MSFHGSTANPSVTPGVLAQLAGLFPATTTSRYLNIFFSAGLLVASTVGGYWGWVRSGQANLEVDGAPISNSQQIIDQADAELAAMAAADGAVLDGSEACFFAPTAGRGPSLLCGPIWLGVSPEEEPWVEVRVDYRTDGDSAIGEVGTGMGTTETLPRRQLTRPDGKRPATPGDPTYSTDGVRSDTGFRFEDPDAVLASAEQFVADVDTDEALTVESSPSCFFAENVAENGRRTVENTLWCGPALTASSSPDEIWAKVSIRTEVGDHFGSGIATPDSVDSDRTWPPPEEATLIRPDGTSPPTETSLSPPPLPTDALGITTGDSTVSTSGSGVLATSAYRLEFTGFARGAELGKGAGSYVAPANHDVIVATIAASDQRSKPVDAVVEIDGKNQRVDDWRTSDEVTHLVVVAPSSAASVDLVVTDNGAQQTISLLDGVKQPGFPAGLYREDQTVNEPFVVRVSMPAGDDAVVSGTVEAATWSAVDDANEWLADGQALLSLEMKDLNTERPCCDVKVDDIALSYVLSGSETPPDPPEDQDPDSTVPEPEPPEPANPPDRYEPQNPDDNFGRTPLQFLVDESLNGADLEISVTVTISVDGEQQQIRAEPMIVELGF